MLIEKICFSKLATVNISCLTIGSPIQELKGLPVSQPKDRMSRNPLVKKAVIFRVKLAILVGGAKHVSSTFFNIFFQMG